MIGAGSLLWIIAIGALVYFMMQKGGCCGGGHNHDKDQGEDDKRPKGGCCG